MGPLLFSPPRRLAEGELLSHRRPLVLGEPPLLLPPLPLASVELLPLVEEPEPEPAAADFSFG